MRVRIIREYKGFTVFVGPWGARASWDRTGYFGWHRNPVKRFIRRWWTGWHRWEDA